MNYKTKKGVVLFLDNFIMPLQDTKLHYQKLNYGIKHFKQIEYPGFTPKTNLKNTQFQIQQEINKQLYQQNQTNKTHSKEFYKDPAITLKPQTLDIPSRRANPNSPTSQFSTLKKPQFNNNSNISDQNGPNSVKKSITNKGNLPEYEVIAMVKQVIPPFPKKNQPRVQQSKEQFYFNIGTTVDLNKTPQNNYQIIPNSLTPFVKIKTIFKNDYMKKLQNIPNKPLQIDNFYRPTESISVDNLDFMLYNGVKIFMCEYQEMSLKQSAFEYILHNSIEVQNKIHSIAEKFKLNLSEFLYYKTEEFKINQQDYILENIKFDSDYTENYSETDEQQVKNLLRQIYMLLIHIDGKFFNRGASVEWVETKYKFIGSDPEIQLMTLNKLANSLKS